jgi:hypothetical protein
MTYGLLVLVQLVIAAMATWPWSIVTSSPLASVAGTGLLGRSCTASPAPLWEAGAGESSCVPGATGSEAGNDSALASSMPVPTTAAVAVGGTPGSRSCSTGVVEA